MSDSDEVGSSEVRVSFTKQAYARYGRQMLSGAGKEISIARGRSSRSEGLFLQHVEPHILFDSIVENWLKARASKPPEDRTLEQAVLEAWERLKSSKALTEAPTVHALQKSYYWRIYQNARAEEGLPLGVPPTRTPMNPNDQMTPPASSAPFVGPRGTVAHGVGLSREDARERLATSTLQKSEAFPRFEYASVDGETYGVKGAAQPTAYMVRVLTHATLEQAKGGTPATVFDACPIVFKDDAGKVVYSKRAPEAPSAFAGDDAELSGDMELG